MSRVEHRRFSASAFWCTLSGGSSLGSISWCGLVQERNMTTWTLVLARLGHVQCSWFQSHHAVCASLSSSCLRRGQITRVRTNFAPYKVFSVYLGMPQFASLRCALLDRRDPSEFFTGPQVEGVPRPSHEEGLTKAAVGSGAPGSAASPT